MFVAGLLLGDADTTVGEDVRAFHSELAGLAEVVVFVSLGLTVHLAALGAAGFLQGLALAVVLLAVARPPAAIALLAPFSVPAGERVFLAWAGMRGAVPILLASLALADGVPDSRRIYGLVFVVVAATVFFQGVTLPLVASALHVSTDEPPDSIVSTVTRCEVTPRPPQVPYLSQDRQVGGLEVNQVVAPIKHAAFYEAV